MSDSEQQFEARKCWLCDQPIPEAAEVFDPGTRYGPHRPVFCSDEHRALWMRTMQARMMEFGEAGARVAKPIADRINAGMLAIGRIKWRGLR